MLPLLPPEARLLVLAIRPPGPESEEEISRLARSGLDWQLLGRLAEHENVTPILWQRLRPHAAAVPPELAHRLRGQAVVTEFRMAMTESVLEDVVTRLTAGGIPVLLMKGAALAKTVYASFAERPMGDLDLLVPAAEAERGWKALVSSGWRVEFVGQEEFYGRHHHLPGLLDPKGLNLILELHRALLPVGGPFALDEAEIWREARPIRVGNAEALVPRAEPLLLHLCIHFAWSHMLSDGLSRAVRDVGALLAKDRVDWDRFVELAGLARASSCAYWTLLMAQEIGGAQVPREVLRRLIPPGLGPMREPILRGLTSSALYRACPSITVLKRLWTSAIQPAASGHGDSRPWDLSEEFAKAFKRRPPASIPERLRRQVRSWGDWMRFASTMGLPRRLL